MHTDLKDSGNEKEMEIERQRLTGTDPEALSVPKCVYDPIDITAELFLRLLLFCRETQQQKQWMMPSLREGRKTVGGARKASSLDQIDTSMKGRKIRSPLSLRLCARNTTE